MTHITIILAAALCLVGGEGRWVLEPPAELFIGSSNLVTLRYMATGVNKLMFQCNDRFVPIGEARVHTLPNATMVASLNLTKAEVENAGDTYWCKCVSYDLSTQSGNSSSVTEIRVASLKKDFLLMPTDKRAASGSAVELDCEPPSGNPPPRIVWLRNNQPYTDLDRHYLLRSNRTFTIEPALPRDSGANFTCVATNVMGTRVSHTATVIVYQDGGWGEWSGWGECDVRPECGKGYRWRSRVCDKPKPTNGGAACPGQSEERNDCIIPCNTEADWSEWSLWSACDGDCQRTRSRTCSRPGACQGASDESAPCNLESCAADTEIILSNPQDERSDVTVQRFIVYFALVTLIAVLLAGILAAVFCLQRKKKKFNGVFTATSAGRYPPEHPQNLYRYDHCAFPVDYPPQNIVPSCSLHSLRYDKYSPQQQQLVPFINHCPPPPPVDTNSMPRNFKPPPSPQYEMMPQNEYFDYEVSSCCQLPREPPLSQHSFASQHHRSSTSSLCEDSYCTARGHMGFAGGRVCVPSIGVSLVIPQGAIPKGAKQEVVLSLCDQCSHDSPPALFPPENNNVAHKRPSTVLSPVVTVGPVGVAFEKPIILSIPHSATNITSDWTIAVLADGQILLDESSHSVHVTDSEVFIMTQRMFTKYCLVGTPSKPAIEGVVMPDFSKRFRLAAFISRPVGLKSTLRVYCIPDLLDAWQKVAEAEENLEGVPVSEALLLHLRGNSGLGFTSGCSDTLVLTIAELAPGWLVSGPHTQELPCAQMWKLAGEYLNVTYTLTRASTEVQTRTIAGTVSAFRRSDNPPTDPPAAPYILEVNLGPHPQMDDLAVDPSMPVFRLPDPIRLQIEAEVTPALWPTLAAQLGIAGETARFLSHNHCPTGVLLDLWEAISQRNCYSNEALVALADALRNIGLTETSALVEQQTTYHNSCVA